VSLQPTLEPNLNVSENSLTFCKAWIHARFTDKRESVSVEGCKATGYVLL